MHHHVFLTSYQVQIPCVIKIKKKVVLLNNKVETKLKKFIHSHTVG